MIPVSMLITERSFPISQREFENGACVDQPRTIDFSECVHLRLGIALQHDRRFPLKIATAE